ncbi:hypothetical protein [Amycolatopsis australiensis]|uniref:Uncharacterized protein n=1 Tax=Amycolatopsis australiensis TaxID=546364 RepID=A0A1K1SVJ7_9PSEU|nr:hypothetical protein [Amycolatopsis australiensis]SFW88346.1 hypothetical protein SAMN04489730_6931 [Amycolatopsis australiensis]
MTIAASGAEAVPPSDWAPGIRSVAYAPCASTDELDCALTIIVEPI